MLYLKFILGRSYQKETISGREIVDGNTTIAYSHLAVIEDVLASCVTFTSPFKVPRGWKYNVRFENQNRGSKWKYVHWLQLFTAGRPNEIVALLLCEHLSSQPKSGKGNLRLPHKLYVNRINEI